MNDPRGSIWRKWDLHVHTPKSLIQHYGGDTPEVWEKFITDLENLPDEFKAIGINDYIFLDGYKKVREYKKSGRLRNIDLILPVIELRIDKFASTGDENWRRVNLHVIFSDKLSVDEIEVQFLHAFQHKMKLSPDYEGVEFSGVATRESLADLGAKIKNTASKEIPGSNLLVGFWNLYFDYETVMARTKEYFDGKCLTAVGKSEWDIMRWDASAGLKKTIINGADFSFISLQKPDDSKRHSEKLESQKVRNMLLDCSDAHYFSDSTEKDRIGNSFTWLNANTTFEGLKQVATERSRISVSLEPELLIRKKSNPTKFINQLRIRKVDGSVLSERWFDNFSVDLNPSLVAIIGNKGNGKSAIADAIGLVGNTPNYKEFSFLNDNKFRKKKPVNLSENFEAELEWENHTIDRKRLSENPKESDVEKVKYIPQGFLEKLCNEDVDHFEKEMRKVIFSHIPEDERFNQSNLEDLVNYKTEVINQEIELVKKELGVINKAIIDLEKRAQPENKQSLENQLKQKQDELQAHANNKPKEVNPPTDTDILKRNKLISDQISTKRKELGRIDNSISKRLTEQKEIKLETSELEKALQNISIFQSHYDKLSKEITPTLEKHELNFEEIVSLSIDSSSIQSLIANKNVQLGNTKVDLNPELPASLTNKKNHINAELLELQNKLDEPSKLHQEYVDDLNKWNVKNSRILGSSNTEGTLEYLKAQINYLKKGLSNDLESSLQQRRDLLAQLFLKKNEVIELYRHLFKPVTDFISQYRGLLDEYKINFDVDYRLTGFIEKFFDHINMAVKGSFIGNPAGIEQLNELLDKNNLTTEEGILQFTDDIILYLKEDKREGLNSEPRSVTSQIKTGYTVMDLYSFLFELDYLVPVYKLRMGEKNISELSPGERGALLLIFYLSLDLEDKPLVIDQPEENLDNQSVYNILVHFITKAKNKRQIIIVTHNPNLAVVCDAEQIIYVRIDKQDKNKVYIKSGALEEEEFNDAVVNILEGTYPAFDTRTVKYKVIKGPKK